MKKSKVKVTPDMALYYAVSMLLFSLGFYGLTRLIYSRLANGDLLRTYLWSIAVIAIVVLMEQVLERVLYTPAAMDRAGRTWWAKIGIIWRLVTGLSSVKPALYLFYLVALVISRVSTLAPGLFDDYYSAYFSTIEGSLILLVVFDRFVGIVVKDYRNAARLTDAAMRSLAK